MILEIPLFAPTNSLVMWNLKAPGKTIVKCVKFQFGHSTCDSDFDDFSHDLLWVGHENVFVALVVAHCVHSI